MSENDLGPKPEPRIEPGEPNPGGVDAVDAADGVDGERAEPNPAPRDLDPADNPAVDEILPEEMKEGEDTETEATKSETGEVAVDQDKESPA
jgi:hypothetical protein